jgi:PAS domain S-box-containing protein
MTTHHAGKAEKGDFLPDIASLTEQLEALKKQNASLEAQVRQRTFELQVLYDLSHQIGYTLNYGDLFRLMLQHLHRVVPYVIAGSILTLEEPYELFLQYTRPPTLSLVEEIRQRMLATLTHIGGRDVKPGQVRLRTYELASSESMRLPFSTIGSVFQVPLIVGPQRDVVGLLFVGDERSDSLSEDHVRLLYTVANQASVAVQQLRALLVLEEQRLESVVTNLPDGILLLDETRHVVLINTIGQEYLLFLSEEATPGSVLRHLGQQSIEPLLQPFPVQCHEIEIEAENDGLQRRVFEVATQPMNGGPQAGGWTVVIRDVTGRKRAEEEIRSLNTFLEQRVNERTMQLERANRDLQRQIVVREQAEEQLRRERDLLSRIMETSPVGIMMADRAGTFIFANPRVERVLGRERCDILQQSYNSPIWEVTDYDGHAVADEETAFQQVIRTGHPVFDVRHAIRCPDGARGLLSINAAPLYNDDGQIERVVFTVRDVTRRVHAEEAIRTLNTELEQRVAERTAQLEATNKDLEFEIVERKRAEEEARHAHIFITSLLENIPDVIFVKDANTRQIVLLNRAAEKMFGSPRNHLIGKKVEDIFPTELAVELSARDEQVLQEGISLGNTDEVVVGNNSDLRSFHTRLVPITDEHGASRYILGISIDITESKRAQAELREAWQAAESATRAKSEFLANMSHEIRTPLNAIIGMTNLMLDTDLSIDQRDFLETILISGESLLAIINDVLDFSKIEAGKLELVYAPFKVRDCVQKSLNMVSARATEKRLNLAYTIAEDIPPVLIGDAVRLRQILVNLLSNAVKFTEQGEVIVEVTGHRAQGTASQSSEIGDQRIEHRGRGIYKPQPLYEVRLSVSDTGIGIAPEHQERLFQSFSQIDPSPSRKYGGTGLGLVISKNLAELMGGTMWVESIKGVGSTFSFTIQAEAPLDNQQQHSSPPAEEAKEPQQAAETFFANRLVSSTAELLNKRVLIIDSNETNRRILSRYLESWGVLSCIARTGAEALEWLRQDIHYDAAIVDIHLPDTDGLALVRSIREVRNSSTLPLIICAPIAMKHEISRMLDDVSIEALLSRPVRPSYLYNILFRILAEKSFQDDEQQLSPFSTESTPFFPAALEDMGQKNAISILLVEDNEFNQKVAVRFLQKIGYQADVVENGMEALEALKTNSYDVLLMDIQMPGMDGMEATRRIRERLPAQQQPWIVAMTAHALRGDRERCLNAGMNDYISKPIQLDELVAVMETAWSRRRSFSAGKPDNTPRDPAAITDVEQEQG